MQKSVQDNVQDNGNSGGVFVGEYKPPFTITNEILSYVSSISEKIGRITAISSLETKPHLRKNNRIKSIHSSLKIEANSLTFGQVRDVINGKTVFGEQREIQEVKNAYLAYAKIKETDPYSVSELKRIHGIMTAGIEEESGIFRSGSEGVFAGDRCIFIAPPPNMVPELIGELFSWMRDCKETVHPLIMAAVFHYEFVFIHPFADGNGRVARLLMNLALLQSGYNIVVIPPIVRADYISALQKTNNGNNTDFINFISEMVLESQKEYLKIISRF